MKKKFTLIFTLVFFSLGLWAIDDVSSLDERGTLAVVADENVSVVIEDVSVEINLSLVVNTVSYTLEDIVVFPKHGELGNEYNALINYSPASNYYQYGVLSPVDSFQYSRKKADNSIIDSIWVYIDSIQGVNDAPIAVRDSFMVIQDSGAIYATVLDNDIDCDRAGLKVELLTGAEPKHGTVTFHEDAYNYMGDYLFFPNDGSSPSNKNLLKLFDQREMYYMFGVVMIYTPDEDFYGYDSLQYIISEYRPAGVTFFQEEAYEYVWNEDADTATVVFYVEPHDYIPVAANDTFFQTSSLVMSESDVRMSYTFAPLVNDLDADTLATVPLDLFELPYIIATKSDSATATVDNDTVVFYHNIAEYDSLTHQIVYRRDSNIASLGLDTVIYSFAPGYSGVDSLYYSIVEKDLVGSDYPSRFRGDTSLLGVMYFVVAPENDLPFSSPDTLDYEFSELQTINNLTYLQHFDVLANDIDIDDMSKTTLATMKSLLGDDFKVEFETYGQLSVATEIGLLATEVPANPGEVRLLKDSVFYNYKPYYGNELYIDSFKYIIFNGEINVGSEWAYVRHVGVEANDDIKPVSLSSMVLDEGNSTIAANLLLTDNDVSSDTMFVFFNADGTLDSPSKSTYAQIEKATSGDLNYYYHQGFTTKDSFQYVVSDLISTDTAWVYINNSPCVALDDSLIVQQNPFATEAYYDEIDVLLNDVDLEDMKFVVPFEVKSDTFDTGSGLVTIEDVDEGVILHYQYKTKFFYEDSFAYVLTDVPAFFAAEDFFTQDTAWVYIVDSNFVADSDGDGIVNVMEDGVEGFTLGEDTIDFDNDSIPNYLDWDADGDGFRDAGDCDGDGVLNFLDDTPGCDDIEVSTVFTPNGDGINDFFVIPDLMLGNGGVMSATIKIYNRLGSLVYENSNYGQDGDWWNGNLGDVKGLSVGDELPNGVYLYYMTYNDGSFKKEGFVHIQR